MNSIALQLYSVRDDLAKDPQGTLERVRAIGYTTVETGPLCPPFTVAVAGRLLKEVDLAVVAAHCELPVGDALPATVELARELACSQVIWHGWPKPPAYDSLDGVRRLADQCNEAGRALRRHGLELGLHNHWWEFELLQGRYPYQVLLEHLDPDIYFEIDVYWVKTAGLDPARVVPELGSRVRFLHVKDGPARQGSPMVALGQGVMDFSAILRNASGVTPIVEMDQCATDIWVALEQSRTYLRKF